MAILLGCSDSSNNTTPDAAVHPDAAPDAVVHTTVTLHPGDNVQAALIGAVPGVTILFTEGTYNFTDELSLSVPGVTLKGMGARDSIILDFSGQTGGGSGNGISVTAGDFVLEGISIQNTKGDSVRVQGADPDHLVKNVTFRNVKVSFTAGSSNMNPGYALYPTTAENVLIENCEVHGASDAGIYVGQSKNIMVRNNIVSGNVNGIEIENSTGAEVTGNMVTDNVAGILVFNLPNLPTKTGSLTVVHDNIIMANNHVQFASDPHGVAALVPPGSGMIVVAADKTEIRNNMIMGNESTGMSIVSCSVIQTLGEPDTYCSDAGYDGFPEGQNIHDNTFSGNGTVPQGFYTLVQGDAPSPLQDVIWDGVVDSSKSDPNGDNKLCVKNNGSATFLQVDISTLTHVTTDISGFNCTHAAVPGINVTWGAAE